MKEEIENMTYNEIKSLAKSLNINTIGKREKLISEILKIKGDKIDVPKKNNKLTKQEFKELVFLAIGSKIPNAINYDDLYKRYLITDITYIEQDVINFAIKIIL